MDAVVMLLLPINAKQNCIQASFNFDGLEKNENILADLFFFNNDSERVTAWHRNISCSVLIKN